MLNSSGFPLRNGYAHKSRAKFSCSVQADVFLFAPDICPKPMLLVSGFPGPREAKQHLLIEGFTVGIWQSQVLADSASQQELANKKKLRKALDSH
jgi:hypothetical protein